MSVSFGECFTPLDGVGGQLTGVSAVERRISHPHCIHRFMFRMPSGNPPVTHVKHLMKKVCPPCRNVWEITQCVCTMKAAAEQAVLKKSKGGFAVPLHGYIIEKYNNMGSAYTCRRLVEEAQKLQMDLRIVGIHDTVITKDGLINRG